MLRWRRPAMYLIGLVPHAACGRNPHESQVYIQSFAKGIGCRDCTGVNALVSIVARAACAGSALVALSVEENLGRPNNKGLKANSLQRNCSESQKAPATCTSLRTTATPQMLIICFQRTGVAHGDGQLHAGHQGAGQHARQGAGAEQHAHNDGRQHDQRAGGQHLRQRRRSGDLHAAAGKMKEEEGKECWSAGILAKRSAAGMCQREGSCPWRSKWKCRAAADRAASKRLGVDSSGDKKAWQAQL